MKINLSRSHLLDISTALLLLVSLVFFKDLWLSDRLFPVVPGFFWLTDSPPLAHSILYYAAILFLTAMFLPKAGVQRYAPVLAILTIALSCLFDVLRLQPAIYLALITLILVRADKSRVSIQIMFVLIYFWTGFQKLNHNFIQSGFERLLQDIPLPAFVLSWMPMLAVLTALIEMSIGIFLIFGKTRIFGVLLGTFFHVLILLLLGPIGLNWEPFVWAWNIWMIASLWILFFNTEGGLDYRRPYAAVYVAVVLLFFVGPVANLFGWWNDYLSFKFYSSNTRSAVIKLQPGSPWQTHGLFRNAVVYEGRINIAQWGFAETGVPEFSNEWYYERFFFQICEKLKVPPEDKSMLLIIFGIPDRFSGRTEMRPVFCSELLEHFKARDLRLDHGPT